MSPSPHQIDIIVSEFADDWFRATRAFEGISTAVNTTAERKKITASLKKLELLGVVQSKSWHDPSLVAA